MGQASLTCSSVAGVEPERTSKEPPLSEDTTPRMSFLIHKKECKVAGGSRVTWQPSAASSYCCGFALASTLIRNTFPFCGALEHKTPIISSLLGEPHTPRPNLPPLPVATHRPSQPSELSPSLMAYNCDDLGILVSHPVNLSVSRAGVTLHVWTEALVCSKR